PGGVTSTAVKGRPCGSVSLPRTPGAEITATRSWITVKLSRLAMGGPDPKKGELARNRPSAPSKAPEFASERGCWPAGGDRIPDAGEELLAAVLPPPASGSLAGTLG